LNTKKPHSNSFQSDRGSITPLGIFGALFSLVLALALASATSALNQQRFLESVAQGIAMDSAATSVEKPQSPISITDKLNLVLTSLEARSADLATRLAAAKVNSGWRNIDGSVEAKICQPPRIRIANQILVLSDAMGLQVCAIAAAINK
jgi:hypothetical protein